MYIGIDGGGTKTKAMLVNENMEVVTVYETGPSSIRTVPFDTSIKNIVECISQLLKQASDNIKSIFAGLGDVTGDEDSKNVVSAIVDQLPEMTNVPITVKNDVYNAHAGALNGEEGIAIIIGTGSVAFGVDRYNRDHRAGGYSYKEGDLGSAYGLGSQALSLLGKVFDKRKTSSPLTEYLFDYLNIHTFPEMVSMYDTYHTKRTEVAGLAPIITKFADKDDVNAIDIIDIATDELMLMIKAVDKTLDFKKKNLAVIGSLGQAKTLHREMLETKLKDYDENYNIFDAL